PRAYHRPEDVASNTPCTLHLNILPKDLADRLLRHMLDESRAWKASEFWLFERKVTSPHTTALYIREIANDESGKEKENGKEQAGNEGVGGEKDEKQRKEGQGGYWYNGEPSKDVRYFSDLMEEAARVVQTKVRLVRQDRSVLSFEEKGPWKANVSVTNFYPTSQSSVGWHSDRLNYLGPQPTIASLSLGASRPFRLKRRPALDNHPTPTISVELPHNSLIIMHPPCQEEWTHQIPSHRVGLHSVSGPARINLTFRMYRPEWGPSSVPKCHCGIPAILKSVVKQQHGFGRYFYFCDARKASDGDKCSFFQ
ncbi:hypothetical protein BJ684DRAFT_1276, partial [Piptocephalis cylindrospora]